MENRGLFKLAAGCFLYIGMITAAYSGQGIGGGAPPAIETESFEAMKNAALSGDIFRYREPGADPVYLQPDVSSIETNQMWAIDLSSGNRVRIHGPLGLKNNPASSLSETGFSSFLALPEMVPEINGQAVLEAAPSSEVFQEPAESGN